MSRLWWAAELVRNGADYGAVPHAFGRTRTAQFALELAYSHYKPAAIAFVRVAEGLDGGPVLTDTQMKRLSRVVNALLSTRVLEACDFGAPAPGIDEKWLATPAEASAIVSDELPIGPADERIPEDAVSTLATWFREIASTQNLGSVSLQCWELHGASNQTELGLNDSNLPDWSTGGRGATPELVGGTPEGPLLSESYDRYRELGLPEPWRPVLVDFAPAPVPSLDTTEFDDTRVFRAFLDASLEPRQRNILLWRYLGGRTLEQIGLRLGLTRERVRQLQIAAMDRVRSSKQREVASESDLVHILETLKGDQVVVAHADSRSRLTSALAMELLSGNDFFMREHLGYIFIAKTGFERIIAEAEREVASRREFGTLAQLALALGVSTATLEAVVFLSDRLYLDKCGRIGTDAWNKVEMMEVVAWILALSPLEVVSWHASELVEALKVVFPNKFSDWRARHAFAALTRPDVDSFVHAGRSGHWALSEAITGPRSTLLAVAEILEIAESAMHLDEIHRLLIAQGRNVRRESLAALLTTHPRFVAVGSGRFSAA